MGECYKGWRALRLPTQSFLSPPQAFDSRGQRGGGGGVPWSFRRFKSEGVTYYRKPGQCLGNKAAPTHSCRAPDPVSLSLRIARKTAALAKTGPASGRANLAEARTDKHAAHCQARVPWGRWLRPGSGTSTHQLGGSVRAGPHDAMFHGGYAVAVAAAAAAAEAASAPIPASWRRRSLNCEPVRCGR